MAASGTEVTMLCSLGLAGVMEELGPAFERETGCRLALRVGSTNSFRPEITAGAVFDVTVLTAPVIEEFIAAGRIVAGSRVDLAQSCVGVAVRPGDPLPDISTVEAFRRALLAAPSIIFTGKGASGLHFASLLPRLGIEAEIRAKAVVDEGLIARRVATGEIALGIQQASELRAVPGAVFVGPIPSELQAVTVFSAGVGARAPNPDGARALITHLASPAARAVAAARGLDRIA